MQLPYKPFAEGNASHRRAVSAVFHERRRQNFLSSPYIHHIFSLHFIYSAVLLSLVRSIECTRYCCPFAFYTQQISREGG